MSNTFRPKYRELSNGEKRAIDDLKAAAEILERHIQATPASRAQSIALTKLEESVMWAVKGATG